MSPESARPVAAGTSMPGCQRSRTWSRAGGGSAQRERLEHAEHLVDPVLVAVPRASSRSAMCSAEETGRRSDWSGRASILPVPQPRQIAARAQRVEQHRLADAAQAGEHQRALGPAAGDPLQDDVEGRQLGVAAGQLGRALAGAGRVRVPHGIHVEHRMGLSSARP